MRRRSRRTTPVHREYEALATNSHRRGDVDADGTSREALDHALRALARLLARQAARELFERECARDVNEDLP
jgi:hypothetical protein